MVAKLNENSWGNFRGIWAFKLRTWIEMNASDIISHANNVSTRMSEDSAEKGRHLSCVSAVIGIHLHGCTIHGLRKHRNSVEWNVSCLSVAAGSLHAVAAGFHAAKRLTLLVICLTLKHFLRSFFFIFLYFAIQCIGHFFWHNMRSLTPTDLASWNAMHGMEFYWLFWICLMRR